MSGAMSKQQQEQQLSPQPCNNSTSGQLLLLHQHFISSSALVKVQQLHREPRHLGSCSHSSSSHNYTNLAIASSSPFLCTNSRPRATPFINIQLHILSITLEVSLQQQQSWKTIALAEAACTNNFQHNKLKVPASSRNHHTQWQQSHSQPPP